MIERLFIWLGQSIEQPCFWMLWSEQLQQAKDSGTLSSAEELHFIQEMAINRPVNVFVSSAALMLTEVTLPSQSQRRALKALPFMLEDKLLQDIDDLHFVPGGQNGKQLFLAVVAHKQMQLWLTWLSDAGIKPRVMVPDCLSIPMADCQWAWLQFGSECLLRTGQGSGHDIPMDWFLVTFSKLLEQDSEAITLASYSAFPFPDLASKFVIEHQQNTTPMEVLAKGISQNPINLLTGFYKTKREISKHLLIWRNAAIAAGVVVLLGLINKGLNIYSMDAQSDLLKKQSEAIYRQVAPNSNRIVNLRSQLKSELNKLKTRNSSDQLFMMLDGLATGFNTVTQLKPTNIRFDAMRGELRMMVKANNFAQIEEFQTLINKKFNVDAGAMNNDDNAVTGTLTIRSL